LELIDAFLPQDYIYTGAISNSNSSSATEHKSKGRVETEDYSKTSELLLIIYVQHTSTHFISRLSTKLVCNFHVALCNRWIYICTELKDSKGSERFKDNSEENESVGDVN